MKRVEKTIDERMLPRISEYCRIRKDIRERELSVPIGNEYYAGKAKLEARWLNEGEENETFQVKYKGEWQDAMSIDFEFIER